MIYWFLDACALARYYFEDLGSGLVRQIFALSETTKTIYNTASAMIFKRKMPNEDDRLILVTSDSQLYNAAISEGVECLHLWSCKCDGCGAIFVANKGKGGQCDSCGRAYGVDDLAGLSREVKVLEIIGR